MNEPLSLRLAREDELDAMVQIDDEASALFAAAGMHVAFGPTHPFVQAERSRWLAAARSGGVYFAIAARAEPVGFMVLDTLDAVPYLDQLAVKPAYMRRGIGRTLLQQAFERTKEQAELWLTTYAHLAWNGPYYERAGFVTVAEAECGPELREVLRVQRLFLPEPARRVVMVRGARRLRHGSTRR